MNHLSCPDCGFKEIIYDDDRAEYRCKQCGAVISESVAVSVMSTDDYASISKDGRGIGASTNTLRYDNGLGSEIGFLRGNSNESYRFRRIRNKNKFLTAKERSLAIALNRLNVAASILGIPRSIKKHAVYIYKMAMDADLIRGRTIEEFVASSLFIACRKYNVPRSLDEIAKASMINRTSLARINRIISKELNIKLIPASPIQYVPRFATKLELSREVEAKAIEIINNAIKQELIVGKNPVSIAATALYMASILLNVEKSQKEISTVLGISVVNLRVRSEDLAEKLNIELNV